MVYETARAVSIPVIGMGGIVTPEDAVEFMLAGAAAVQVGTASYADPRATERLVKGLESWCRSHDVERVASLTGAVEIPRAGPPAPVARRTEQAPEKALP
jgi:dihydroorotate dehydrogenase (NAD+) catalytic subunit